MRRNSLVEAFANGSLGNIERSRVAVELPLAAEDKSTELVE